MTGLTANTAEPLQIQNYGIAGHFKMHYDHQLEGEPPFKHGTGNRIATMLFYVSFSREFNST